MEYTILFRFDRKGARLMQTPYPGARYNQKR